MKKRRTVLTLLLALSFLPLPAQEQAERAAKELAERERQATEKDTPTQQAASAAPSPSTNWYVGIQGGIPFGVSALSSFGADKTRAGWSFGNTHKGKEAAK